MTRQLTAAEEHALGLIYGASWPPEKVFMTTQLNRNYNYAATNYFKALVELRKAGAGTPPPPPPPPVSNPNAVLAQNVMFTAWDPEAGLRAPAHWRLAISADVNVAGNPDLHRAKARLAADAARAKGMKVAAWGNQEQVGAHAITEMADLIMADYRIFQGETEAEWASALGSTALVIVGNPNAASAAQRFVATNQANGWRGICFETYTNEGAPWPDQSSSAGVPAHSFCLGVGWGKNPSLQLADYRPHVPAGSWPGISVYLAEKMADESWGLLP